MSQIRGANTSPEVLVRRYLHANGFRFRINAKDLPGKPDIKLTKYKTVIFINGCFWHKHDCKRYQDPKSNSGYWLPKIQGNVQRDKENAEKLVNMGWQVIIIWECEIKTNPEPRLQEVLQLIRRNER